MSNGRQSSSFFSKPGFTLIELLIVIAIIAILALIAIFNMREATERAMKAANAGNLHTLAVGLQSYMVDHNTLPPADATAGPFDSSANADIGNAPAAGGSWDGVPWRLIDLKYVTSWQTLFNPKYLKLYRGGTTIRGGWPRYHNFRYAYNKGSIAHRNEAGGSGVMTGTVWVVRDLYVSADAGFYGASYPNAPADYRYPWDDGDDEHVMYADFAVKLVKGGTDILAK